MNRRTQFTTALLGMTLLGTTLSGWAGDSTFVEPPHHVGPPLPSHALTNRAFQGIPSLAVTPGGRLWATWYAGKTPAEDQNNYVVLSTSNDGGVTWHEVLVVDPDGDGPLRAFDPNVWVAPDGKLRLVWAQSSGHEGTVAGVWFLATAEPESQQPEWDKPVRVTDGIMMCKPLVLSTGEWVLPASTWRKTDRSARMVVSTDQGKTWTVQGACNVPVEDRAFDEHMFIERKDKALWLLARTRYGIGQSVSTDRGVTWPELEPSTIAHPSARFFITRLNSGNLLLVKHGPIAEQTGRSHLTAYLSADDGKSWAGGLILDERAGVSYPDGQQTPDGLIRIIYDYSRTGDRLILMATFREEDVAAGKAVTPDVRFRGVVSKASGGVEARKASPPPVDDNKDGKPLRTTPPGALSLDGAGARPFGVGERLFKDRGYVLDQCPTALKGASFLQTTIEGAKRARCTRSGMIHLLTPQPSRNADSQTKVLLDQGFEEVAIAEIPLFNPTSAANYCTCYQKQCAKDEIIEFGKWAVPVLFP